MKRWVLAQACLVPLHAACGTDTAAAPASAESDVATGVRPPKHPTPLTTGNGFGFAVYDLTANAITKLYAHPYRFVEGQPGDATADGVETPSFVSHLAWNGAMGRAIASYPGDANVIEAANGSIKAHYFMPFGVERNVLVAAIDGAPASACLSITWKPTGRTETHETVGGRSIAVETFGGQREAVAIVPLDAHATPRFGTCVGGATAFALVSADTRAELEAAVADVIAWQGATPAADLTARVSAEFEAWRAPLPPGLSADEKAVYRQSEAILREAQIREPNTATRFGHGLIAASLPPGEWFIPWVRDMSVAVTALARMGHREEARMGIDAYLDAERQGVNKARANGFDYQISTVRYFGSGAEEADFSGEDSANFELDDWGLALGAIGAYQAMYADHDWYARPTYRGTAYASMRDFIVAPLLGNLDAYQDGLIVAKDTSCWEQNDTPVLHYASSTIAAIHGLRSFVAMAEEQGDTATATNVNAKLAQLEKGFAAAFHENGRLRGVVENETSAKNDVDAAFLEAVVHAVEKDPAVIEATFDAMSALKCAPGGYRRVVGPSTYEKHEFVFTDFGWLRSHRMIGDAAAADAMLRTITARSAADHHVIPEMYVSERDADFPGNIGDPTGAIPMVGYGAGAYVLSILERAGL